MWRGPLCIEWRGSETTILAPAAHFFGKQMFSQMNMGQILRLEGSQVFSYCQVKVSRLLHSFLPSPLSTYKGERRRKGVKQVESCGWKGRWRGGYGWRGWVKMMLGWCEGGARLERWWNEGWGVEKVIKNWYQVQGYIYCIYSHPLRDPLLGILSFPFHFPAAFSLLSPSPPFYMSISAQYPHSSFRKES